MNQNHRWRRANLFFLSAFLLMHGASCSDMMAEFAPGAAVDPYPGDVRVSTAAGTSDSPRLVWTGTEYGLAWNDARDAKNEIYFTRISAAGAPQNSGAPVNDAGGRSSQVSIAWTGSGYGLAFFDLRAGGANDVYFARLDQAGVKQGADVRITNRTVGNVIYPLYDLSFIWTGSGYGVTWSDYMADNMEVYFTRISATGVKQGGDSRITSADGYSEGASLVWRGSEYGVAWHDDRNDFYDNYEIYFTRISAAGAKQGSDLRLTNAAGYSWTPKIVWTGSEYGEAWMESRDGDFEIYFARISAAGAKQGSDLRVTNAVGASGDPSIVWTGTEYGAAWTDDRDGNAEIYFVRISAAGVKQGEDVRVTHAPESSSSPSLVWSGDGYGLVWTDRRDGNEEIYFARLAPDGAKIIP